MDDKVIEINKNHSMKVIDETLSYWCNEIRKQNDLIKSLESKIAVLEQSRLKFARAYAEKIGLLVTKRKAQSMVV